MAWHAPDGFEKLSSQKRPFYVIYERSIVSAAKDKLCNESDKIFNSKKFKEADFPHEVAKDEATNAAESHNWHDILFEDCVGEVACEPQKLCAWISKTIWLLVGRMAIYRAMHDAGHMQAKHYPGSTRGNKDEHDTLAVAMLINDHRLTQILNHTVVDACKTLMSFIYVGEAEDAGNSGEDEDDVEAEEEEEYPDDDTENDTDDDDTDDEDMDEDDDDMDEDDDDVMNDNIKDGEDQKSKELIVQKHKRSEDMHVNSNELKEVTLVFKKQKHNL